MTHVGGSSSLTALAASLALVIVGAVVAVLADPASPAQAQVNCSTEFPFLIDKPSGSGVIRVAAINTDGGQFNGATTQARDDQLDDLASVISCLEADLVFLSEVHRLNRYWPDFDMLNEIRARSVALGHTMTRIFAHACKLPNGQTPDNDKAWVGNGIMSTDATNTGLYSNGFLEANYDHFNGVKERSLAISMPTDIPTSVSSGYPGGWGNREGRCFTNPDDVTRWRGRHHVAVAGITHTNVEVIGIHLSPAPESADVRRDQLAELASQIADFRAQANNELGSSTRPAVMAGDFNEDDCIFDGQCSNGDGVAQFFSGEGWVNATDHITVTTGSDSKLDHIFVRGLDTVTGSDQTHARAMDVGFLNHHVVYGDFEKP